MDKERLEMIKHLLDEGFWEFDGEEDVRWLVKQVEKQQKEIEKLRSGKKALVKVISADVSHAKRKQ